MLVQLTGSRLSWMLAALLLLVCASAFPAQPQSVKRYQLAIDAGSLSSVLNQFSRQTGLAVMTSLNVAESKTNELGPFVGYASADAALEALLKDTDLTYTWENARTITIQVRDIRPPRSENNVNEVLVTGTRLDAETDGPAPVRVYRRERLERHGVSSVADLSRYFTQQPSAFSAGHLQSGAQFFQLRGLGVDTTLVLVNGRRMPPSANGVSLNAVDLNTLPLTAVERIEVMSDSASAIYGADAIGGVVNIILKDKIEQPEIYLHYGQADGGGTQRRAAASLGTANGRLRSTLVVDYYETAPLMGEERELWRNQDYSRFGGQDYRVSATHAGNVYSLTGLPLPGLSSSRAAVPRGATGGLSPAHFFATDGAINLGSSFSDWSITPLSRRTSAYGAANYCFAENLNLFGEFLMASGELIALRGSPSLNRQIVPASNPFNPFGEPVAVDYSFAGMDRISHHYQTDLLRLVGGARGSINRWNWEITGLHHREVGSSTTRGGLDPWRVIAAIDSDDPQTALNLFTDGPAGTAELLDSLIAPAQRLSLSFSSTLLSAFIRGPAFNVGERTAELVVGAEWRHDAAGFFEPGKRVVGRDIASVFSEIRVPLLDQLSLGIAARSDDYGAEEQIVNPQYGLTWRPSSDWHFRAAYGTSFRPPSLFELNMPMLQPSVPIADPLRGGEVSNVNFIVGGNRDLEAVIARSFTAGVVFKPSEMPGLRLGGSYWRVVMDNRIMVPIYQELLNAESVLADRIGRDPPSGRDVQMGWAGRLRRIDLTRVNYGDLETSGIDLDTSLLVERDYGSLQFDLAATWVDKYLIRDMNRVLPLDRVGIANVQGTIPEWRAVGTLTWKLRGYGASTTTTFVPSYQDADVWIGPIDRRIGSQILVDLQAWMDLDIEGNALLDGSTFTLGARNLFDQAPEFANAGASLGYDVSQSELTGRFIYFRVRKRF